MEVIYVPRCDFKVWKRVYATFFSSMRLLVHLSTLYSLHVYYETNVMDWLNRYQVAVFMWLFNKNTMYHYSVLSIITYIVDYCICRRSNCCIIETRAPTLLNTRAIIKHIENINSIVLELKGRRGPVECTSDSFEHPSKVPVVSLSKKLYPYYLVLVGSSNGCERDITIKLK